MELILNEEDVKKILLEWSQRIHPQPFDEVEIDCNYRFNKVTLSFAPLKVTEKSNEVNSV